MHNQKFIAVLALCFASAVYAESNLYVRISGNVNPNGCPAVAWFDYGLKANPTNRTPNQAVVGTNGVSIDAIIGPVIPFTGYVFRVSCSNVIGATSGLWTNFVQCPPVQALTDPATSIGTNAATLNGHLQVIP